MEQLVRRVGLGEREGLALLHDTLAQLRAESINLVPVDLPAPTAVESCATRSRRLVCCAPKSAISSAVEYSVCGVVQAKLLSTAEPDRMSSA